MLGVKLPYQNILQQLLFYSMKCGMCCCSKIHGRDIVLLWHQINILQGNQPCPYRMESIAGNVQGKRVENDRIFFQYFSSFKSSKMRKPREGGGFKTHKISISKFPTLCFLLQKIKQLQIQLLFCLSQKSNLAEQTNIILT